MWSHRLVMFMIPVLVIAALSHHAGLVDTPTGVVVLGVAWAGCFLAVILGVVGVLRVWKLGIEGLRFALTGILVSLPLLAIPLYFVWLLFTEPQIHDITTDTRDPPMFDQAARLRGRGANPIEYPGGTYPRLQHQAYPEIQPFRTGLSTEEAFAAALKVARDENWDIVFSAAPPDGDSPGRIEAVASTLLMGFMDDVVIRVAPDQGGARVDMRSASRYGAHDFGANADRVQEFLFALREALAPTSGGER